MTRKESHFEADIDVGTLKDRAKDNDDDYKYRVAARGSDVAFTKTKELLVVSVPDWLKQAKTLMKETV